MHVHRTEQVRNFTVLPNGVLQFRQLSYTARGLLADLLSRPDGWREDARHMADTSPQGRGAIRKALKELTEAGFYRVEKIRMPDGTLRTRTHVYDAAQAGPPGATRPVPGGATTGGADVQVKNPVKEPSLPAERTGTRTGGRGNGPEEQPVEPLVRQPPAAPDKRLHEALATLFRVIRPEPRLRLGEREARELSPLVAQWLDRGSTPADLAHALLPGLPSPMHSPVAVLRHRLQRKMPPDRATAPPPPARYTECAGCHDPVPRPGICGPCAGLGTRSSRSTRLTGADGGAAAARAGATRARDAMRTARAAWQIGPVAAAT
ncbi:hypothetical protein [Kitasatospora camelliae]|uniref:Helix-turn-helix protein n=1 Tax=Kitasatospora camelliae TaxID=3156397 RepID=A0AAU8JWK2_9ACTN